MAQKRIDELKEKIRVLVETPLFVNADLLTHDLLAPQSRILQLIHKQPGIYGLLRATQINQAKCLGQQLAVKQVGMTALLPGVYDKQQVEYMKVEDKVVVGEDVVKLLDVDEIVEVIVSEMMGMDIAKYGSKREWDVYDDFRKGREVPKIYSDITM